MPQTLDLNKKANVRQKTAADLLSSSGLPVVAEYSAESVASQTMIPSAGSLPFAIDTTTPENVWVFVDGKRLRYGASNDFVFAQIDGSGFSSKIQLNASLAAGLNIMVSKLGIKKEVEFMTDARFSALYDMSAAGFQGMVDESSKLTAVNGTPSAGQFRTFGIIGRASIPDLANDLKARMGIDRIPVQQIVELQNEAGTSAERVWAEVNDTRNLMRFVGAWRNVNDATNGARVQGEFQNDYVEIVFYGTGLNLLTLQISGGSRDWRVTVDGGSEGADIYADGASILSAKNYTANQILNITSGLALGLHTVKIRNAGSANLIVSGFEVLNESSSVNVRPGVAYASGKKLILSAASNVAYNTGFESVTREGAAVAFSSTRGARVIEYLKSDNTKSKAAYLTNAAQANMGSADHTYEELVRTYSFREFGAGRSDDFSSIAVGGGTSTKSFTLDDGVTTLAASTIVADATSPENLRDATGTVLTFIFIGTGLDIIRVDNGSGTGTQTYSALIDGASIGSFDPAHVTGRVQTVKVVSGLPYGTHIFQWVVNGTVTTANMGIAAFKVYQPKKPSLPSGAVELADYCVMADFVATTAGSIGAGANVQMATGVLLKNGSRENAYFGSGFSYQSADATVIGSYVQTSTASDSSMITFFGTGIEISVAGSSSTGVVTVQLDGANYTGAATATNGGSWTPGTSTFNAAVSGGSRLYITGLSLAMHTIRITHVSGTNVRMPFGYGVITPIHSHKSLTDSVLQNALPVGSQGLSDSRKLSLIRSDSESQVLAVAKGISSGPSTSSTSYVPMPDMSVTIKLEKASRVLVILNCLTESFSGTPSFAIFVNGVFQEGQEFNTGGARIINCLSDALILGPGAHKIDAYYRAGSGAITLRETQRSLKVLKV